MEGSLSDRICQMSEQPSVSVKLSWFDLSAGAAVYNSNTFTHHESSNIEDSTYVEQIWHSDDSSDISKPRPSLKKPKFEDKVAKPSPATWITVPHSPVSPTRPSTDDDTAPSARRVTSAPDALVTQLSMWRRIFPFRPRSRRTSDQTNRPDMVHASSCLASRQTQGTSHHETSLFVSVESNETSQSSHGSGSSHCRGNECEFHDFDSSENDMNGINVPDSPRHAGFIRTGSLRSSRRGRSLFRGIGTSSSTSATRKQNRSPRRTRGTPSWASWRRRLSPSPDPTTRRTYNLVDRTKLQHSVRQRHL